MGATHTGQQRGCSWKSLPIFTAVNIGADAYLVQMAQSSLADIAGGTRPLTGYVQTSDGRWFAGDGIPIIHLGPGDPALAHATDAYVPVEQLVEGAKFLPLLGLRWQADIASSTKTSKG